jgi:protein SDA1
MGRKNRTIAIEENFPLLQNQIKRDPIAYKAEFMQQYRHYQSLFDVFQLSPNQESSELGNLITFMSHVCVFSSMTPTLY